MIHLLLLSTLLLDPSVPTVKKLGRPEGVKIVYDVRGAGETTLVFVHGWSSERGAWREQANYFAAKYQVVTLDLGAHGQSTPGRRKVWTVASLADDVRAVVDSLKLKRVILVGHSMGGPVSLLAAAKLAVVQGVILVDSLHDADVKITREQADGFAGMFKKDFRGTMTTMVRGMFPAGSPLADEVIAKAVLNKPAIMTALIADYPNLDLPAMLRAVKVPVRAINAAPRSANDPATNLAVNRKYADFDATVLQGPGHFLMLEKPGEFNALLREWLGVLK
jgi:pimeloyl-ACP methyl ester carboxylesterase